MLVKLAQHKPKRSEFYDLHQPRDPPWELSHCPTTPYPKKTYRTKRQENKTINGHSWQSIRARMNKTSIDLSLGRIFRPLVLTQTQTMTFVVRKGKVFFPPRFSDRTNLLTSTIGSRAAAAGTFPLRIGN